MQNSERKPPTMPGATAALKPGHVDGRRLRSERTRQLIIEAYLALLREDGLVATRKASQAVFYRLADPRAARLLEVLRDLYCPPDASPSPTN